MLRHSRLRPLPALAQESDKKMPLPPYEPPTNPNWFDLNWIVAAIGGLIGAFVTGIGFVWHTATTVTTMKNTIKKQGDDIERLDSDLASVAHKQDQRHEENQRAISGLREILAKQPTRDDFRDFATWFRQEMSELRRTLNSKE